MTTVSGRRALRKYGYKKYAMRRYRALPIVTNTAAVRENYTVSIPDGNLTYFSTALSQSPFNRAQAVAENFQEYRIKYVKLIFRPSADTFPIAAGNTIPQLYFQMNKYQAIPTGATLQSLLDMGCRPIRFDDKNVVKAYKPVVLMGADQSAAVPATPASGAKVTPWLSTNGFAGNPNAWIASDTEHCGCIRVVTKPNPATPTINYEVDVEVVFQFRRPLSLFNQAPGAAYQKLDGDKIVQVAAATGAPAE